MKKILLFALTIFATICTAAAPPIPELRMTPTEITSGDMGESQIGSSKLAGVHTKILAGNPAAAGFYSILLFVPAHTTIQAHSHHDDRMATVASGTWHFGYGTHFDEKALKTLPVGSVYSEPGGVNHFARTAEVPVVVHISGFGPTDTRYFNPADDPEKPKEIEIAVNSSKCLDSKKEQHYGVGNELGHFHADSRFDQSRRNCVRNYCDVRFSHEPNA